MTKRLCLLLPALLLLGNSALAVVITADFERLTLDRNHLQVYVDREKTATVAELIGRRSDAFRFADKNSFPYSNAAIWSRVRLHNAAAKRVSLRLINDFVAHDEVDVYLVKDGKVGRTGHFGDTRTVSGAEVLNRFANSRIVLEQDETVEVLTRYASTTPISIKMKLLGERAYAQLAVADLTIWGLFIGVTIALAIYNFMMFLSLHSTAFLFYVLHSLANLYNTLTSSGHVYAFLSPLVPLGWLNLSYKVTPSLAVILMSLFIITFFDLKHKIGWLYRVNLVNAGLFAALIASLLFFYPTGQLLLHNRLSALLLPLALLVMLFSALVVAWRGLFAGRCFLFGAGTFFFTMLSYVLYFTGLVDFDSAIVYALPSGMAAEAILFSIALGQKLKRIEKERAENALLVEESNKFNSTSYLLAGILHQFKQPLIHLGAEVLKLRTERYRRGSDDPQTEAILGDMESQIAGMNDLVGNFYGFYSQQATGNDFDLQTAVDKVLAMLAPSLQAGGVRVIRNVRSCRLRADEKALKQILLILLENAITALQEKQTVEPRLRIDCSGERQVRIEVRDNAGGIAAGDLDKIFNIHFSKKQAQGLGIGLALARKLAETRLNGSLSAGNEQSGACFVLVFQPT